MLDFVWAASTDNQYGSVMKWVWIGAVILVLTMSVGKVLVETLSEKKKLAGLIPPARSAVQDLRQALLNRGIRTLVGQTRRTDEQQANIDPGKTGTSDSWHELGRAVDLYVYGPDGKPDMAGAHTDIYRTMHAEAKRFGLSGLAFNPDGSKRFITTKAGTKVWDGGHLQFTSGLSYAAASDADRKAGYA
jgi:hypothetical protein